MSKNIHHRHGENIKKIAQVPEKPVSTGAPDLLPPAGGRSPDEVKRIRRQAERNHERKAANQTHA
jgi:hypothetical protein